MKKLFDSVSEDCSKSVTQSYSTSFSMATKMLHSSIRNHIYNIYGFVRFADEIVDSFHEYPKEELLNRFDEDLFFSLENKISFNKLTRLIFKTSMLKEFKKYKKIKTKKIDDIYKISEYVSLKLTKLSI